MSKAIHQGHNIKRFREMQRMKQETLADALGKDWNQTKISLLENKEVIDGPILEEVAKVLKVPADIIRDFDWEDAIVNIQNNYEGSNANASNVGPANIMNYQCNFNPLDKYIEAMEENKRLYEALLKEKEERIRLLEKGGK